MTISAVSTLFLSTQSGADLQRVQGELADLQRQVGSQHKADSLKGYAAATTRILSAQSLMAKTDARQAAASNLLPRLDTIDLSLGGAADATETLRQAVLSAVANDDGRTLKDALQTAFSSIRTALNTEFEGEALFSGERVDQPPVNIATLDDLAAAPTIASIFSEAARPKTIDLGDGPRAVAEKASDVSSQVFAAMQQLKQLIDANGGTLPQPLTTAQKTALTTMVSDLEGARYTLVAAQGRNGDLSTATETKAAALSNQSDALAKMVGDAADADLAEVATKITSLQVQYQAIAQTFSSLSQLSLLDYLR
ncbi:MAG: hypothetical protein AB7M12_10405 [Hyphomonadaceae bacterium]